MENHKAYCADVGSIPKDNFGWASSINGELKSGFDIAFFADDIAEAINNGYRVSIGFECPLFLPVRDRAIDVAAARDGEGQRSWSAGAGTGALATGIVQCLWVMRRIRHILGYAPKPTFDWKEFEDTNSVFFWEAFVTSGAKGSTHCQDAELALRAFLGVACTTEYVSAIQEPSVISLLGACAIRAGWSDDIELLRKPCLVIKA